MGYYLFSNTGLTNLVFENEFSELPEEKPSKNTDSSINDLYNSINGASDSDNKSVSIDDLYESINNDDDDDDDDDTDE